MNSARRSIALLVRIALPALLCAVAGCAAPGRPAAENAGELAAAIEQYYRDFSARDWARFRDHFHPGATLTTVWQPPGESSPRVVVTTIDEFLKHTSEGPDSKPIFEELPLDSEVTITGILAQVWSRYEARFGDAEQVATWQGVDAFTWMKHAGRWRIVSLAYTNLPDE